METVNIHCAECNQLIGIAREDLGHHVECPLCRQVILAKLPGESESEPERKNQPEDNATALNPSESERTAETVGSPPNEQEVASSTESEPQDDPLLSPFPTGPPAAVESDEESIFSSEDAASDDIFGTAAPAPKVEMPDESRTYQETPKAPNPSLEDKPAPPEEPQEGPPTEISAEAPGVTPDRSAPEEMPQTTIGPGDRENVAKEEEQHASSFQWTDSQPTASAAQSIASVPTISLEGSEAIRRVKQSQMLSMILLIFFVPYSILSTGVIGWLWVTRESYSKDPLERMLEDQGRKPGGIQRIKHNLEVPAKLRTSLGKSLQVGAVEFTPLKVALTEKGDLVLQARLRNISQDLKFNPLPAKFADPRRLPYLFLEIDKQKSESVKAYGAEVQWFKGRPGDLQPILNTSLRPKESMTVELTTVRKYRSNIEAFRKSGKSLLWRIHLRRGLENILGRDRGITCVIGVEFDSRDITKA